LPVLVSLAVREDEQLEAVQDLVLTDLEGTSFTLRRRMRNTPLIALAVGNEAFCLLVTHDRVTQVERDGLARPHRSTEGT
jgi:hypothetical protein